MLWEFLVFWSLPPSVHGLQSALDSHSWKYSFISCSVLLWSQPRCRCPVTELAFIPLPLLVFEALSTTEYCSLYSFWDPPTVTGIYCPGLQSTKEQERFREEKQSNRWIWQFIHGETGYFYQKQKRKPFALSKYLPVLLSPNIQCIEQWGLSLFCSA